MLFLKVAYLVKIFQPLLNKFYRNFNETYHLSFHRLVSIKKEILDNQILLVKKYLKVETFDVMESIDRDHP